jgi:CDP-glucose 4,6-dehydratase
MQDWRGTRVLVTGHTGFKGSWLCEWLLAAGAEVSGFALEPATEPNLVSILGLRERTASFIGDVRDPEAVNDVLSRTQPEVVFHLAAQALVLASIAEPVETFATNVMGTVHVLDAVRRTPSVEAIVVVTSDKCYENSGSERPYRESDPMGGKDPYSSSKGCTELATTAFRRTYFTTGTHVATARAGNVIGGGDWSTDRIVPDIARALAAGQEPVLRFPKAVRPWQHVLDAIAGYVLLAEGLRERDDLSTAWNFGPDESSIRTVAEVTEGFMTAWGVQPVYRVETPGAEFEARMLRLDSSFARGTLGWSPALPFDEAIAWTARWYRAWNDGGDLKALTAEQLRGYRELPNFPRRAAARP